MGTILISEIFERTGRILQDEGATRWTSAELIDWYNEGLLDMVTRRPMVNSTVDDVVLSAGAAQVIAANRIAILDVGQNLGSAAKPRNGIVPQLVAKDFMDKLVPDWAYSSTNVIVQAVIASPTMPDAYWVYPPQPSVNPGRVRMTMSVRPTVITATTSAFEFDDRYAPIIIEYLLYRAMSKDSENPQLLQLSNQHFQTYLGMLGVGQQPQQG